MLMPKISAILNNCPVHVLTPELKAEIKRYADNVAYENPHTKHYKVLKECFATYYALEPDSFTWQDFSAILQNYNPFDVQILLGPVLRLFSKKIMAQDESDEFKFMALGNDYPDVLSYINATSEISDTGRYESLSPDHLFRFICSPLGFSLTYYRANQPYNKSEAEHSLAAITIYHQGAIHGAAAGGHWERNQDGEGSVDYQTAEDTQLTPFLPLLGEDPLINPYGIDLLKKHVQLAHRHTKEQAEITNEIKELIISSAQIQQYLFNSQNVPKTLAVQLLKSPLCEITRDFIAHYPILIEVPSEQIYERYLKASAENKPAISVEEQCIIARLEAGVCIPEPYIPSVKKEFQASQEQVDDVIPPEHTVTDEANAHQISEPQKQEPPAVDAEVIDTVPTVAIPACTNKIPVTEKMPPEKKCTKEAIAIPSEQLYERYISKPVKRTEEQHSIAHLEAGTGTHEPNIPRAKESQTVKKKVADVIPPEHPVIVEANARQIPAPQKQEPPVAAGVIDTIPTLAIPACTNKIPVADKIPLEKKRTNQVKETANETIVATPQETNTDKNTLPNIKNIDKKQELFELYLNRLNIKSLELLKRRNKSAKGSDAYLQLNTAYTAASNLHHILLQTGKDYFSYNLSYLDFKKICEEEITQARPALEPHRGYKEILANIALFIASLVRSVWHGKMTFFSFNTDSIAKVNEIQDSINKVVPEA